MNFFNVCGETRTRPLTEIINKNLHGMTSATAIWILLIIPIDFVSTEWVPWNSRYLSGRAFKDIVTPDIPNCGTVTLIDGINIQLKCVTERVFPDAMCLFYINTNETQPVLLITGSINYKSYISNISGYVRTECFYTFSAGIIGPGSHMFYVVMYPNIKSNITEAMKRTSNYTVPIAIDYPKAVLAHDCDFIDYIKENEKRTCKCYDDNPSFLLSQVRWSIDGSSNSTLIFTARRPLNDAQIFQCIVSNSLNWTNAITYQPVIAYPPNINLTISSTEIDICDENNVNILGNCFLSPSFPQPLVQVYINNVLLVLKPQTNSNVYTFNSTITSSGLFNVTCYAITPAFSVNVSKSLLIKGPPEIPAIYKFLQDDDSSPSESTRQALIMCQSRGGYPSSKNISLTCGSVETEATNVDNVILQLNVTNTQTDANCTCVVWHESKCLKNMTTEKLKLYFLNDSKTVQVNIAAIGVGVTLAIVIIVFIIVFITRQNKRNNGNQKAMFKTNENQEYSNTQADSQYANNEMHAYETANTRSPSYSNEEFPTPSINRDKKDEHPYSEYNRNSSFNQHKDIQLNEYVI